MKKQLLSWTLVLVAMGLTLISCKKDKDENNPEEPKESSVTDARDDKVYKTIKIGSQTWFAENLKYDGVLSKGNSYDPFGSKDSTAKYGKLYNWDGANVACPNGWRLPSDLDYRVLESYLGMSDADTAKVGYSEERGADKGIGMKLQNLGGLGFNFIIRSGISSEDVWTSSMLSNGEIYVRGFDRNDNSIYRGKNFSGSQICVRCLKN